MPMELRKIVFYKDEMKSAAYTYCLHASKMMPDGVITDAFVKTDPELLLVLRFEVHRSSEAILIELSRSEIATALIRYCRRIGVPVPRNAKKGIQPNEDGIAMMINLNYRTKQVAAA